MQQLLLQLQQRLNRATDPEVMGENDFNSTRRSRRKVTTTTTTNIVTLTTSPHSASSDSVQIVSPIPPSTIIDLTVENIEDLMMADLQEQKSSKGKRKHVANESS